MARMMAPNADGFEIGNEERSILILSKGKDCRLDSEEYPVPKSSMAICTPSDFSWRRIETARGEIIHQYAFGDFQFQPAGGKTGFQQHRMDQRWEVAMAELTG